MKTELEQSNGTANATTNSNSLFEKREIANTPFTAIRMNEEWFLTMGKYRLTEPAKTFEEIEEDAKDASWNRILQIIMIVVQEEKPKIIREALEELVRDHSRPQPNK